MSRTLSGPATTEVGRTVTRTTAESFARQAKVDAQDVVDGWYSRLDQAVIAKGNTQSGADWMRWAEARSKDGSLSMEEVKWTGLADFLQGKTKVTPADIREFLKDNKVKVGQPAGDANHQTAV